MAKTKKKPDKQVVDLLLSTKREGMDRLCNYLIRSDYFEAPASTKFHGAYKGGLVQHCLDVYKILNSCPYLHKLDQEVGSGQIPLVIEKATLIIPPLLHDLAKVGAYVETSAGSKNPFRATSGRPKGHALVSIAICKEYIQLTQLETMMIKYHMGLYGLHEFYGEGDYMKTWGEFPIGPALDLITDIFPGPEFPIRGDHSNDLNMTKAESKVARYGESLANAWYHNPIVKLMYFADETATQQEKYAAV